MNIIVNQGKKIWRRNFIPVIIYKHIKVKISQVYFQSFESYKVQ